MLFEFFEAKFTESKSNLSQVFVPAGLPGVCLQVTCRAGVFSSGSQIEFFFFGIFRLVNLLELFFESLLELPCFPAFYFYFLFFRFCSYYRSQGKRVSIFSYLLSRLYALAASLLAEYFDAPGILSQSINKNRENHNLFARIFAYFDDKML